MTCESGEDVKKALAIPNPIVKGKKIVIKSASQAARAEKKPAAKASQPPPAKKAKGKSTSHSRVCISLF